MPIGRYTSDEFWELEREHLWTKVWVMAGRAEDIPDPGDYFTFDDLGTPILIVRGNDGAGPGLLQLVPAPGRAGRARRPRARPATCSASTTGGPTTSPAARWSASPTSATSSGFCRAEHGLVKVSCEVWQSWIFVNQDPNAAPLRDWYGQPMEQLEELAGDTLHTVAVRSEIIACNWKVTAEAFLEVYHFRHIHARGPAGGDTTLDNRGAHMGLLPNGCSRMITPFSKRACELRGMQDWSDWQQFDSGPFLDIPTDQRHGPLHELGLQPVPQPHLAAGRLRLPVPPVLADRQGHDPPRLDPLRAEGLGGRRAAAALADGGWTTSTHHGGGLAATWRRCSARWSRRR